MRVNGFMQILGLLLFLLFAVLSAMGHYYLGLILFLVFLVWYMKKGQYLKGWISSASIPDMENEAQEIETLSRQWLYQNGEPVAMAERKKLTARRMQLLRDIADAKREQ